MKILFISFLISMNVLSADWNFKPTIYSRGGITLNSELTQKGAGKDPFNLGAWGDESNAISNNLTEISLEANLNNEIKYTYGIDVNENNRYYDDVEKSLNERLNFIEFLDDNKTLWVGQRAYRGDGDYLTLSFPLGDHNMFGGGVKFTNVGPIKIEFAYGIKQHTPPYNINLFINKLEMPLNNGMLKSNIEVHNVNSQNENNRLISYIAGLQFKRWGDKLFGGDLYNILLANYSHGYIYSGGMQSVFNTNNKNDLASKIVLKWGGDLKFSRYMVYYTFKYQYHKGGENQKWSFVDNYIRPLMALNDNISFGCDYSERLIINKTDLNWGNNTYKLFGARRIAALVKYTHKNDNLGNPHISFLFGHVNREKDVEFFSTGARKKKEFFFRINYEISI